MAGWANSKVIINAFCGEEEEAFFFFNEWVKTKAISIAEWEA